MVRQTKWRHTVWPVVIAGVLASRPVFSGQVGPQVVIHVTTLQEVVTRDARGNEQVELKPAGVAGPGSTLLYRIAYTNKGDAPALGARIVDPIPAGTELIPRSWEAAGAELTVSVDGGMSFASFPVFGNVTLPDGTTGMREVAPGAYTHLRWTSTQPLAPGETREAVFKVIVR